MVDPSILTPPNTVVFAIGRIYVFDAGPVAPTLPVRPVAP